MQKIYFIKSIRSTHAGAAFSLLLMGLAWWYRPALPLAMIGLIPFLYALERTGGRPALKRILFLYLPYGIVFSATVNAWLFTSGYWWRPMLTIFLYGILFGGFLALVGWYWRREQNPVLRTLWLIAVLLTHESLHGWASFGFPVFGFGNYFRFSPQLVQWYALTGVAGGTAVILGINSLFYHSLSNRIGIDKAVWTAVATVGLFVGSLLIYRSDARDSGERVNVRAIHTDYDCHNGKYGIAAGKIAAEQLELLDDDDGRLYALSVLPETSFNINNFLEDIEEWPLTDTIRRWYDQRANDELVLGGGISHSLVNNILPAAPPPGIDRLETEDRFYYNHNTVYAYRKDQDVAYRHKLRLVPFTETVPLAGPLGLRKWFGEALSEYIHRADRYLFSPFPTPDARLKAGTLDCYEAAYGGDAARLVRKGATVIAILANDGWFSGLGMSRQFAALASLRAAETRTPIVRSSNRGVTAIYDHRGTALVKREGGPAGVIHAAIRPTRGQTPYVRLGNWIGMLGGLYFMGAGFLLAVKKPKINA